MEGRRERRRWAEKERGWRGEGIGDYSVAVIVKGASSRVTCRSQ